VLGASLGVGVGVIVRNNVKKVQNDKKNIDMSNTSQAVRIAAKKSSTYAEAVKKQNANFLKNINEHISLKRDNPFLKHLNSII